MSIILFKQEITCLNKIITCLNKKISHLNKKITCLNKILTCLNEIIILFKQDKRKEVDIESAVLQVHFCSLMRVDCCDSDKEGQSTYIIQVWDFAIVPEQKPCVRGNHSCSPSNFGACDMCELILLSLYLINQSSWVVRPDLGGLYCPYQAYLD